MLNYLLVIMPVIIITLLVIIQDNKKRRGHLFDILTMDQKENEGLRLQIKNIEAAHQKALKDSYLRGFKEGVIKRPEFPLAEVKQPNHYAISAWCCSYVPGCLLETVCVPDEESPFLNFTEKEEEVTCHGCKDFLKYCEDIQEEQAAFEEEAVEVSPLRIVQEVT